MTDDVQPSWWRRRNWWKIGFFVALFAFEVAREVAVISTAQLPEPGAVPMVINTNNEIISATGRWRESSTAQKLSPNVVRIECWRSRGLCVTATTTIYSNYIGPADIDYFDAKFTPEAVTYEEDYPCAHLAVRIDLKIEKVFSLRSRKPGLDDTLCKDVSYREELTLGDSFEGRNVFAEHVVPLLWVFGKLIMLLP